MLERERTLRNELESNTQAEKAVRTNLDRDLASLDDRVAELKEKLLVRERSLSAANRMVSFFALLSSSCFV